MARSRTRNRRTRDRRGKEGAGGAPKKNRSQEESTVTGKQLGQAAKVHSKRTASARHTDESLKAPIAGSLQEWLKAPNRTDLPGVDYPGKSLQEAIEQLEKPKKQISKGNPFKDSRTAKKTLEPLFEEYLKKLGIKEKVKLSAVKRGVPAKVIQGQGKDPIVRFNYDHFKHLHELLDKDIVDRYMEYAVSHELAHVQQREQLGWKGFKKAKRRDLEAFELDADERACEAMGCTVESIVDMIDEAEADLLKQSNSPVKELEEKPPTVLEPSKAEMFRSAEVIAQIMEQKPELTDEALQELIMKEMEDSANLLRFDVAAVIVADSLGVKLEKPEKPPVTSEQPGKPSLRELQDLSREAVPENPRTLSGSGKQPPEHWLPPELEEELIKEFNRPEDEKTGVALVKYFTPDGSASWYLSEYYPKDDVFYGWCDMGTGYPELGYVSRKELENIKGKMGLPIERDYHYQPQPLHELSGIGGPKKEKPGMPEGSESIKEKKSRDTEEPQKLVSKSFMDELEKRKFWAYSGEDGDLYRKQGLGGWRVQVYWGTDLAIQHKITDELGTRWVTVADFDNVADEDRELVMGYVDKWMKNPRILEDRPLNETVTLNDIKQPQTPHKPEPRKVVNRSHQEPKGVLIRPKGAKARTEYYSKAMPYTLIYNLDTVEQITVKDGSIHFRGMDPSHIAMIDLEIPNRLGIPDGEYSGETLNWLDSNTSLYKTPDRIEWKQMQDGGEIHLTKGEKTIRLVLTQGFSDTDIPEPRIRFNAKADIDLKQLQVLISESQAPHIEIQAYQAEDGRNKLRAWWNEERAGGAVDPVSHVVILNEDIGSLDEASQTTYDKEYLKTLLDNLTRGGATMGEIQFSTDMPLQLDTEVSEAVTRFWLAPCIDVGGGRDRYHPEDPRTTVTKGSRDKQEWRDMATPYSVFSYIASGGDVDVNVSGSKATLRAMDSEHIAMIEVETNNLLDIPDGEYGGSLGGVSGNMGTYRYPEKLLWDPELNQLIVDKKGNQAIVDLEAGKEYAQLPHITEGAPIGDVNLSVLSQALNDAWKKQKNEYPPSIVFKQQDNEIVLEYANPEGTLHTDTLSLDQAQGALLESTSYNPGKLRNFIRILEPMNPEHVTIKQNEGQVLTLEAVKGDSVIRYHLAPMTGA